MTQLTPSLIPIPQNKAAIQTASHFLTSPPLSPTIPPTDLDEVSTINASHRTDTRWMQEALAFAQKAAAIGEVPVAAVWVSDEGSFFTAHNLKETRQDATAHAELVVLQAASKALGRWRLGGTLYCTLEPCVMCAGALVQARVDTLVFATHDVKAGACGSVVDLVRDTRFNHVVEVKTGLFEHEAASLLKSFFSDLRKKKK